MVTEPPRCRWKSWNVVNTIARAESGANSDNGSGICYQGGAAALHRSGVMVLGTTDLRPPVERRGHLRGAGESIEYCTIQSHAQGLEDTFK